MASAGPGPLRTKLRCAAFKVREGRHHPLLAGEPRDKLAPVLLCPRDRVTFVRDPRATGCEGVVAMRIRQRRAGMENEKWPF